MSKRFTDTEKWSKAWYRKLTPKMKCAWAYLCDKCSISGVWHIDMDAMSYFIGEEITEEDLFRNFEILKLDDDKVFIPSFIKFQNNLTLSDLNESNKIHKAILKGLDGYDLIELGKGIDRLSIEYRRGIDTVHRTVQVIVIVKDKVKVKVKGECEGENSTKPQNLSSAERLEISMSPEYQAIISDFKNLKIKSRSTFEAAYSLAKFFKDDLEGWRAFRDSKLDSKFLSSPDNSEGAKRNYLSKIMIDEAKV